MITKSKTQDPQCAFKVRSQLVCYAYIKIFYTRNELYKKFDSLISFLLDQMTFLVFLIFPKLSLDFFLAQIGPELARGGSPSRSTRKFFASRIGLKQLMMLIYVHLQEKCFFILWSTAKNHENISLQKVKFSKSIIISVSAK